MVRASVSQGQITVPVNMSARSEQNVQNSNIKQNVQDINKIPGFSAESTPEGSECLQGKDEKEVDDDDWDAFQSLPATAANDAVDSGDNSSDKKQIPQENISDADIAADAIEGGTCGKELEDPSD